MENFNMSDISSTLNVLEKNLTKAFVLNDKLEIARAAIELGSFAKAEKLENFQSAAIASLVQSCNNAALQNQYRKEIESVLTSIFRSALNTHIDETGMFNFYTKSYGGEVDKFSDAITKKFGFNINGFSHCDTELELRGNLIGGLKDAFYNVISDIQFRAVFEDYTGEGDECYNDVGGFRRIYISKLNLSTQQFNIIEQNLNEFRVMLTLEADED